MSGLSLLKADIKAWWKAALLGLGLWAALSVLLKTPCWFRLLFGVPCPFCGMTRAGFKLLCLDFAGAWAFQPMLFFVVLAVVLLVCARYISRRLFPAAVVVSILCFFACVGFYVWKMATVFPNKAPYVVDEASLIRFLWERSH